MLAEEEGNSHDFFSNSQVPLIQNVGEESGQTIFHCHVHLIPRRKDDVKDPRGGVRGVIPNKQKY